MIKPTTSLRSVCGGFLLSSALWVALSVPAGAQNESNELAAKLAEICRKHDLPAMTAAVVNADGTVDAECFGHRKRGTTDQVELSDRFPLGSCTKSITATLAAVLVDDGKIDWDTSIGDVWPTATADDIHPKLRTVTLDQLLSHQSGLPSNISGLAWSSFFLERQSPVLERRRMLRLVLSKPPAEPQGTFSYANLGYVVVAAMLETRARESFESLMKKHIFDPLEMNSAGFRTMESAKQLRPPLLWGHHGPGGEPVDPRSSGAENPAVYAPAGTVHVSIEDYAKYARWHLLGKPAPVLRSQAAFDHLHEPLTDRAPGEKYGCGWICVDNGRGLSLTHGGSNTNAFALIWVVPADHFAAVVCTNSGQPQAFPACNEMIVHLMTTQAGGNSSSPDKKMSRASSADHGTDRKGKVTPERLVGRYQLAPNCVFDVRNDNGRIMVGITNQPRQEVFADTPTKWSYRGVDATLEFHLRGNGRAYRLTLHQNGAAQHAKRIQD